MSETILSVAHLHMRFGGIKALNDVNLDVARGSITSLIGPNGAGKTTVFNCLTGFYRASGGQIMLNTRRRRINVIEVLGERLRLADGFHPTRLGRRLFYKMFGGIHLVNRAGLARTFQNIRLFREMSVVENLLVAQHMQINRNLLAGILNTPAYRRAESQALDRAFYWLEVVDLVSCANRLAGEMSYGQQRRLAIARALMSRPKLLLLDEPSLGLAPIIVKQIFQILRELAAGGMTLFLVEQNAHHALTLSDRGYVMVNGQIRMSGPGKALLGNEEGRKAYLGGI